MKNINVIVQDLHGCFHTFQDLITWLQNNYANHTITIYSVGDLIDRGFYSIKLIDLFMQQSDRNSKNFDTSLPQLLAVKGNHELMFLDACDELYSNQEVDLFNTYFRHGGIQTFNDGLTFKKINEYVDTHLKIEQVNRSKVDMVYNFLRTLPYFRILDSKINNRKILITHTFAGLPFSFYYESLDKDDDAIMSQYTKNYITFNRDKPLDVNKDFFNVFGHTIHNKPIIQDFFINLDTGIYKQNGNMSFFIVEDNLVHTIPTNLLDFT